VAILGNNIKSTSGASGSAAGRMQTSIFTLAAAGTLTELHGLLSNGNVTSDSVRLVIYADSAGSPGSRVAYTSPLTIPASSDVEVSEAGFSVPLAAGNYWLGYKAMATGGPCQMWAASTGGTHKGLVSSASDPPPNPFGTPDTSGTRNHCVWGVVVATGTAPVADFTGTPTTGTASLSVTFTDSSLNIPTGWAWDFGDGGTSTAQNPTHSYTNSGVYTVSLTATNSLGSNTKTRTAYITVAETIVYATGGGIDIY
jgi:PKD domain-containing protein